MSRKKNKKFGFKLDDARSEQDVDAVENGEWIAENIRSADSNKLHRNFENNIVILSKIFADMSDVVDTMDTHDGLPA